MDSKACQQCGTPFRSKWRRKDQNYCTLTCYNAARKTFRSCAHCGSSFEPKGQTSKFCSRKCSVAGRYVGYTRHDYTRTPDDFKPCACCRELKSPLDFPKDASRQDGLFPYCRQCSTKNSMKHHRELRSTPEGRARNRHNGWITVLKSYGITERDYLVMLEQQEGVCAVCKQPETHKNSDGVRPLAVDHDHRTGRVRGLLCHRCNLAIGYFKDDPERLMAARDYLLEGAER